MTALRARAGNLTAALCVVAFAELVLYRVIWRLFISFPPATPSGGRSTLAQALLTGAPFLVHLAGLLGLMVLAIGVVGAVRRRELFPPALTVIGMVFAVIGMVFLTLTVSGIVLARLPERYFLYLQTCYAFLAALLTLGFLRSPVAGRVKLGLVLFALPGILHADALFLDRMPWAVGAAISPSDLIRAGEACALVAALMAPFLLPPKPLGTARLGPALAASTIIAAGMLFALITSFDAVHTVALYGLRLEIPAPPSPLAFAYVLALLGLVLGAWQLLATPGGSRLAGYGVVLAAVTGYQLATPHALVLSLVALSAMALGAQRARVVDPRLAPRVDGVAWRDYVSKLAGALRSDPAPEAVVVHDDDLEITRIRCVRGGRPVSLRVLRRDDTVTEFETTIGEPGRGDPDATISPRLGRFARPLGPSIESPRAMTGDPDFDRRFVVHGKAPLDDELLRLHLLQSSGGHVALWRAQAVRYRAVPGKGSAPDHPVGPAPLDPQRLVEVLDTLTELLESTVDGRLRNSD